MSVPVAAIDFGASSIRVCRVDLAHGPPALEVVHRFAHRAHPDRDGVLRWDWLRLLAETERGLELARERGPIASIGVDTWGVDYGLLDRHGRLVEPPISYRDRRTEMAWRVVADRVGVDRLYATAGLQLLPINTIFQLAAHDPDQLARAAHVLTLPELVVHHLTGAIAAEPTSAGTTGLLDVHEREWSSDLCDAIGLDRALLPPIAHAGVRVGAWRDIPVHLVGGHDTASAVFAGSRTDHAFVASGTWLLVGREQPWPDTSEGARTAGLTNEQAVPSGIRLLRNVAGWWLVEECRRIWGDPPLEDVLSDASAIDWTGATFDAADPRFVAPSHMPREIARASELSDGAPRAVVARAAIESMAATTVDVLESLPHSGTPCAGIRVFGGGARAALYLDALRTRTELPVSTGPVEAAALGNALVQGVALGTYASFDAARATLRFMEDDDR